MEPKPIKPSRGSGEAVCGSLPPWLFWAVVVPAACSLLGAALLSVPAAPVELVADWSDGGVELAAPVADWSEAGGVVLAAPVADWSLAGGVVLAAPVADWSEAGGVVLAEADGAAPEGAVADAVPEGEVAEAEADGEVRVPPAEALWLLISVELAPLAGAEAAGGGALVLPVPEAEAAVVSADGCAPVLAEGAAAPVLACPEADWSELGMLPLAEADGVPVLVLLVVVVCVVVAPAAGAAEAPVVLQDSAIIFKSETLNLLSEPMLPVTEAWCPTWASRPLPSSL
jgi:hypothetical protein